MIFFIFLCGFGLTIVGSTYLISYLNLFTMGYNFYDYVHFIVRRYECWYFFIGIVFMIYSMYIGGKRNELYI
ncbi:MAG: hypothetical protein MRZ34_01820 [Bacillales bacterium]|nr:hypothetical protein [Bacillales bacterium]